MSKFENGSILELQKQLSTMSLSPASSQDAFLDLLARTTNNEIDIIDPNNAAVYMMGVGATAFSDAIHENVNTLRKLYPIMAKTFDDVYRHMSDEDYTNIFADMADGTFRMMVSLANFEEKGIVDPQGNYRTMRIPVDSSIEIGGHAFSFNYPLIITRYKNESIEVHYDATEQSSIESLSSLVIPSEIIVDPTNHSWIQFDVTLKQVKKTAFPLKVTYSTVFQHEIIFEDQFKTIELYHKMNNEWHPIKVTHNQFVLDSKVITAKVTVHSDTKRINITMHDQYIDSNKLGNEILVVVYTTKGRIDKDFRRADPKNINFNLRDISVDNNLKDVEDAFKRAVVIISAVSPSKGGRDSLTLEELKSRVGSNNIGMNTLPITSNDLFTFATQKGYFLEKLRDNLTDRVYLLSNNIPQPNSDNRERIEKENKLSFSTRLEVGVNKLRVSRESLENNASVRNNGNRYTITEKTLFKKKELSLRLVDNSIRVAIDDSVGGNISLLKNALEGDFLYTPFHYVMDYKKNSTEVKAYYLNEPKINRINFLNKNTTVKTRLSTAYATVDKIVNGYALTIGVSLSEDIKDIDPTTVKTFISFKALDEDVLDVMELIYIEKDIDDNLVFKAMLRSNLDIDDRDAIHFTDFPIRAALLDKRAVPLVFDMNVAFALENAPSPEYHVDEVMDYVPNTNLYGIAREVYQMNLGVALTNLFTRTNTLPATVEYETYAQDIKARYQHDIYLRDSNGDIADLSGNCSTGPTLDHAKGDIVLDTANNPIYSHMKGDVKLTNGKPIVKNANQTISILDIIVFSHYLPYITSETSQEYFSRVFEHIVLESTKRINETKKYALERTDIFYRPENSNDFIEIVYGNRSTRFLEALRRPVITLSVTPTVFNNTDVKNLLKKQTSSILNELFSLKQFTLIDVLDFFKERYLDEVIDVNIGDLFDGVRAFRLSSNIDSFSVGKRIVLDSTGVSLTLEDDVTVNFIEYSV